MEGHGEESSWQWKVSQAFLGKRKEVLSSASFILERRQARISLFRERSLPDELSGMRTYAKSKIANLE